MRVHNSQQTCEILTLPQGPFDNLVPADLKTQAESQKVRWYLGIVLLIFLLGNRRMAYISGTLHTWSYEDTIDRLMFLKVQTRG